MCLTLKLFFYIPKTCYNLRFLKFLCCLKTSNYKISIFNGMLLNQMTDTVEKKDDFLFHETKFGLIIP